MEETGGKDSESGGHYICHLNVHDMSHYFTVVTMQWYYIWCILNFILSLNFNTPWFLTLWRSVDTTDAARLNIKNCILPTHCIYVFRTVLTVSRNHFTVHHWTNLSVRNTVLWELWTKSLYKMLVNLSLHIITPMFRTHVHLCCSYLKDKRTNAENFPKSSAVSEVGEHCIEKHFPLFVVFKRLKLP